MYTYVYWYIHEIVKYILCFKFLEPHLFVIIQGNDHFNKFFFIIFR